MEHLTESYECRRAGDFIDYTYAPKTRWSLYKKTCKVLATWSLAYLLATTLGSSPNYSELLNPIRLTSNLSLSIAYFTPYILVYHSLRQYPNHFLGSNLMSACKNIHLAQRSLSIAKVLRSQRGKIGKGFSPLGLSRLFQLVLFQLSCSNIVSRFRIHLAKEVKGQIHNKPSSKGDDGQENMQLVIGLFH